MKNKKLGEVIILYWYEKSFKDIQRLLRHVDGSNNYRQDRMDIEILHKGIIVETVCINDYGTGYSNNDRQFIPYRKLSNYVMRKLFL